MCHWSVFSIAVISFNDFESELCLPYLVHNHVLPERVIVSDDLDLPGPLEGRYDRPVGSEQDLADRVPVMLELVHPCGPLPNESGKKRMADQG